MANSSEESNISLAKVLAVARLHPFYDPSVQYPPDVATILQEQGEVAEMTEAASLELLAARPVLQKDSLYTAISRLVNDTRPENTYRRNAYVSTTGGGGGSKPLFFATDAGENRRQRAAFGRFVRSAGIIKDTDWVLSTHYTGHLYRSLDLMLEVFENAGASVLSAGHHMKPTDVIALIVSYNVNVLTGESSQIVQIVSCIAQLSQAERDAIRLDKIIYTSEVLTMSQRQLIHHTLGHIKIYSVMGSAEAGPWAVSSPDITGPMDTSVADFIYDKRSMHIEILPLSALDSSEAPPPLPHGERGILVQTSLSRLRNPLVRYNTGDVASLLGPLPEHARDLVSADDWPHFGLLRLYGRDSRASFDFNGNYLIFSDFAAFLNRAEYGILQWQIILDRLEPSFESSLEIRLLCGPRDQQVVREELVKSIREFCYVWEEIEHRFRISFMNDMEGFERSKPARKVIKFVDRYNVD